MKRRSSRSIQARIRGFGTFPVTGIWNCVFGLPLNIAVLGRPGNGGLNRIGYVNAGGTGGKVACIAANENAATVASVGALPVAAQFIWYGLI